MTEGDLRKEINIFQNLIFFQNHVFRPYLSIYLCILLFRAHCTLLMSNLNFWVQNLDDLDLVVESIKKLGETHKGKQDFFLHFCL